MFAYVVGWVRSGERGRVQISNALAEAYSVERRDAEQIVGSFYDKALRLVEQEAVTFPAVLGAFIGGTVAAVIGGVIWSYITIATNYELGIVAWGIGGLGGFGVLMLSQGKRGVALQVVAAGASILGIAVGKYLMFYHAVKEAIAKEYGSDVAAMLSPISEEVLSLFGEMGHLVMSGYDVIWIGLAAVTAWKMLRPFGEQY